jgi:EmrB/QacA subfamily drug resistance transporter
VCVAIFMLLLDITIVNVALPNIEGDLGASFTDLQWIIDAYALMLAALLLTAGSLADRLGRRTVFAIGVATFSLASLACGAAPSPVWLELARGAQGVGGAMMFATSLALLAQEFHGKDRGTAFGIWGATTGASVAIGPLVGGALTDTLGWRWIFFVNLPIGLFAILVTLTRLRNSSDPRAGRIDWAGLVTFTVALLCGTLALLRGNAEGWTSPLILTLGVVAAVSLALFVVIERRAESPMFELSLFRGRSFTGAQVAAFTLSCSVFSLFLYITLYLQNVLGYSPFEAGLRVLPITLLSFAVAPLAGKLSARVSPRVLIGVGLLVVATGLLLLHGIEDDSGWTGLFWGFVVMGAGLGMVNPPLASLAISVVPPRKSGMASGINNTFRQIGIATGIAALGALFQARVQSSLTESLAGTPIGSAAGRIAEAVASGSARDVASSLPPQAREALAVAARHAFIGSLNELFLVSSAIAVLGGVLTFSLVRRRDLVASGEEAAVAG